MLAHVEYLIVKIGVLPIFGCWAPRHILASLSSFWKSAKLNKIKMEHQVQVSLFQKHFFHVVDIQVFGQVLVIQIFAVFLIQCAD